MTERVVLATRHGIVCMAHEDGVYGETGRAFEERDIRAVGAQGNLVLAGGREGILRSTDAGRSWEPRNTGLNIPYVRWIACHPNRSGLVFAGTEPAAIFLSDDGGQSWEEQPVVSRLREVHQWSLPYSPAAGCVRGFACSEDRIYAAVEQGGLLRSDDAGASWRFADGTCKEPGETPDDTMLHPDVHSVHVHAGDKDCVFASTGCGFYRSHDAGTSWTQLYACYCRASWVDPRNKHKILLGPASGVSRNGRIEISNDGGTTWLPSSGALPLQWERDMVERFYSLGNWRLAVLTDGRLLGVDGGRPAWRVLLPQTYGIRALTSLSGTTASPVNESQEKNNTTPGEAT